MFSLETVLALVAGALLYWFPIRRWYKRWGASYDSIDNGRQSSAERIVPELQRVAVGALVPALPGATDGFVVADVEPDHFLVLGWQLPQGGYLTT